MSVRRIKRRDPRTGAVKERWLVDVDFQHANGQRERVRKVSPVRHRRGAEEYERQLRASLLGGTFAKEEDKPPVPTVEQFKDRFIQDYCKANKQKPSGIESKQSLIRLYLLPLFATRRLDSFSAVDEDRLKASLATYSAATYNNAASTMNSMLKAASRWKVIRDVSHRFLLLKRQKPRPKFYDVDEYQALMSAAAKLDPRIHLVVLLGGDAGLRRGEIMSLEWTDADLRRGLLTVERSEWKGSVTETKGMKVRVVPMTKRLQASLSAHRHLRGSRILYTDDGETVTAKVLQKWIAKAQQRAGLRATGALHILRHTFCSHLAMRGAPALSIQRLAGHENLQTTLGYMHLAKGETERAIRLLDAEPSGSLTATDEEVLRKVN